MVSFTSPMVLYRRTARSRPAVRIWRLSALKATLSRSRFAPKNWRVLSCVLTSKRRQLQRGDATAAGVVKRRARAIRAGARGAPAADARAVPRRRNRPLAVHRQLHVAHKVLRGGGGDGRERRARAVPATRARARARSAAGGPRTLCPVSRRSGTASVSASPVRFHAITWGEKKGGSREVASKPCRRARAHAKGERPAHRLVARARDEQRRVRLRRRHARHPARVAGQLAAQSHNLPHLLCGAVCVVRAGGATCKGGGARQRQRAAETPSTIRAN